MSVRLDIMRNLDPGLSIAPASITATTEGDAVSLVGKGPITIGAIVDVGAVATADATHYFTVSFTECATAAGTYTAIPAARVSWIEGDGIINATTEADTPQTANIYLARGMDYVRAYITETGTAEAIIGVMFLKPGRHNPVST